VLTVQTAGILDTEGYCGRVGKQASWIQFADGKVTLAVTPSPAEGGKVTPGSGRFDYDSDITLTAMPAEGYDFAGWSQDGEIISTSEELDWHLTTDTELKALFTIKHYSVTIDYDPLMGTVEGAATGIYSYGTELQLNAVPSNGYEFEAWMVNDVQDSEDAQYTLFVTRDMDVRALFGKPLATGMAALDGELRVAVTPRPVQNSLYVTGNFREVRQLNIYDMRGIKCLTARNVQAGQAVPVGRLGSGIYSLQVVTDKGMYRTKIVKR